LDTNVVSDLTKARRSETLREWIDERDEEILFLSVITIG
jgi:predicted nucleic acid-binding protein